MLSAAQRSEFEERGYTRVAGAIPHEQVAVVSASVWHSLATYGMDRNRPETWQRPKPKGLQTTAKNECFAAVFGNPVRACLDALLGERRWEQPEHWGQLLLSLPTDNEWSVPHKAWHLDLPEQLHDLGVPGVQIFICIEDALANCGATVVATGTHRLVAAAIAADGMPTRSASSTLRSRLRSDCEWFQQLTSNAQGDQRNEYFKSSQHLEGDGPLQVEELTGNSGDLILMHPYLFHAPAQNVGPALRMALTQRVYLDPANT